MMMQRDDDEKEGKRRILQPQCAGFWGHMEMMFLNSFLLY